MSDGYMQFRPVFEKGKGWFVVSTYGSERHEYMLTDCSTCNAEELKQHHDSSIYHKTRAEALETIKNFWG